MSYNSLPPELKHQITEEIRRSDERYEVRLCLEGQKRMRPSGQKEKTEPDKMDTLFRGMGIDNWSRVNKACRKLCGPLLFGTIKDHRALELIFQHQILNSSAASGVTKLVLTGQVKGDKLSLLLFHIAPRLPNLSKILVCSSERIGLGVDAAEAYRWNQLVKLAQNIADWEFESFQPDQVAPLLAASADKLRGLTFHLSSAAHTYTLPLFQLISACHSVTHLLLHFPPLENTPLFSSPILHVDYTRLHRLKSLTISCGGGSMDESALRFASLFPNLQILDLPAARSFAVIPASTPTSSPSEADLHPIILPTLSELQLSYLTFDSVDSTLGRLSLPSLRHLTIKPLTPEQRSDRQSYGSRNPVAEILASHIKQRCGPSFQLVTLDARYPKSQRGPYLDYLALNLQRAYGRYVDKLYSCRYAEDEDDEDEDEQEAEEDEEVEEVEEEQEEPRLLVHFETELIKPRRIGPEHVWPRYRPSAKVYEALDRNEIEVKLWRMTELLDWAGQRIKAMGAEEDLTGLREMDKGLREIERYKKWMED